jgi:two-component system alkaline phosphatase synthesis response regulator PhoP
MKRILLMDDSEVFREIARHNLQNAGYEVVCASDLAELERHREASVDLILMDVQMPEAHGDDLAMTLKFAHQIKAPIYLLSSLDDAELAERASWAKIDGFISKNRGMDAILDEVRRILD